MNTKTVAVVLVVAAFAVMVHQFLVFDVWWSWDQVLHHEVLAVGLVAVAAGLMITRYWRKTKIW